MNTLRLIGLLFLFMILSCSPPKTDGSGTESNAGRRDGVDIRGEITNVLRADAQTGGLLGTVLIEGTKEADTNFDRASVRVMSETRLIEQKGDARRPVAFSALRVGDRVEARFTGPVLESYPVQATASEIVVLRTAARGAATGGEDIVIRSGEVGDTSTQTFEGTARAISRRRPNIYPAVLREVRFGRHPNFDRVVFEFEGDRVPGYHVEYVDRPVRDCGAGEVVPVGGDGLLLVRITPAHAHRESGEATVSRREYRPNLPVLKELELICDFEAQVEWVLGVSSPNRYRVLELSNPARLVIDVKH